MKKKLVFITAKTNHLPDKEEQGNWSEMQGQEGFYILETEKYFAVAHKCMDKSYALNTETEVKHDDLASWLDIAYDYCDKKNIVYDDVYLICHDKDLLNLEEEEYRIGIFRNDETLGSLHDKIKDGNIYAFMHTAASEMWDKILIQRLLVANEQMIDNAIQLIKKG